MLRIIGLTVIYDNGKSKTHALNNISFSLNKSTSIGIIGESGSGKTSIGYSILNIINRKVAFVSGLITYNGQILLGPETNNLVKNKYIIMVTQHQGSALCPIKRIGQHFILRKRLENTNLIDKQILEEAMTLLSSLGIQKPYELLCKYPFQLSGGELQRICIAIALSCNPDIIILDEPTSALDSKSQTAMLSTLLSIKEKSDLSIILLTHDISLAENTCDYIIVLRSGIIIEEGSAKSIVNSPKETYTKELICAARRLSVIK